MLKKSAPYILIMLVIIALGVALFMYFEQKSPKIVPKVETESQKNTMVSEDNTVDEPAEEINPEKVEIFASEDAKESSNNQEDIQPVSENYLNNQYINEEELQAMLKNAGQTLPNVGEKISARINQDMVAVKAKNNVYYFTTFEPSDEWAQNTSRVYIFNANKDKLIELYWERGNDLLETVGLDNENKLVLFRIRYGMGLEIECYSMWLDAKLEYLNLEQPADGTEPYEVPDKIKRSEQKKVDDCIETSQKN